MRGARFENSVRNNITLTGMPGAGKSTTGIILAKNCGLGFINTDVLIQINRQKTLQQILDASGHLALRDIEEGEILKLNVESHVIATGGSAVYSRRAMGRLISISTVVFIEVSLEQVRNRVLNFAARGIAKAKDQSMEELYLERQGLYKKYAQITVDGNDVSREILAVEIASRLGW
ncbi:MAG: (d)CMP kinase [Acidobacteria bacterium]|nr:(d)CMP kinase [Acidobacteriota bacterium]